MSHHTGFAVLRRPQVPAALRQQMILKDFDLAQLDECSIDSMFKGVYRGGSAFSYLLDEPELYGQDRISERISLEVSNVFESSVPSECLLEPQC